MTRKPRKKTASKKAARRPGRKKATPCDSPAIVVELLGQAIAVEYKRDGRTYRHKFKSRTAKVHATIDGKQLIIGPAKVRDGSIYG